MPSVWYKYGFKEQSLFINITIVKKTEIRDYCFWLGMPLKHEVIGFNHKQNTNKDKFHLKITRLT